MIVLPNIDGRIWDVEHRIPDIIAEYQSTGSVTLDLNSEGPCAESLGLYRILDQICDKFHVPKNKIIIHTRNQIEHHHEYIIKISPPLYVKETQEFWASNKLPTVKIFDPDMKHCGIFIGRSNWIRLWLAAELYHHDYDKTLMTYHWRSRDEFHAAHIGLDEMIGWGAPMDSIIRAAAFLQHCPLGLTENNSYPIPSPEHLNVCRVYPNFFFELVCETYYNGNSFYPTEKIWRPLLMKTPFLIHGSVGYLQNLKRMGFQTFDKWWTEEYDDYGHDLRVNRLLDIIEKIRQWSIEDLQNIYEDMRPVLDHNHHVFMSLSPSDFRKLTVNG